MIYINIDDLLTYIQKPLLEGSIMNENKEVDYSILDNIEADTIDLVKGYLIGRYEISKIFDSSPVLRNGILVQIISMITVYRAVKRNAARKVPEDYKDFYSDSIALLERIQSGALVLENMPQVSGENGASLVWGNNTNQDFFI